MALDRNRNSCNASNVYIFTGRVRENQSAFDLTFCAFIEGFASNPDEGSVRGLSKANNHNNQFSSLNSKFSPSAMIKKMRLVEKHGMKK